MNIFQNTSKTIPTDPPDEQIVRVSLDVNEIGGRKSHLPKGGRDAGKLTISHIPNSGSAPGMK